MSDAMHDVWDTAAEATIGPKIFFGQVFTLADYVYISKGEPKVLFDPGQHKASNRFTQIKIDGQCTRANGSTYEISREIICEFGREWAGIVLPSLKICGIHPRDLNEQWAKWEMVETGQTFVHRTSGETVKKTTFKFLKFYSDEVTCRTAEKAHYSRASENEDGNKSMPSQSEESAPGNDKEREVAKRFLSAIWGQAKGDVTKFGELLAGSSLVSKYFDLNSPEVVALVAESA